MYKAKVDVDDYDYISELDIPIKDGYVVGYLVDDYMVGGIADVTDEYFSPSWWVHIDKGTVQRMEDKYE